MDDDNAPAGGDKALGRARESLRGAGAAALRGLLRARERVTDALGSAAGRLKESGTGERLNAALEVRRVIKRAEAAHARGNAQMAYRLLEEELRAHPGDEKLTLAFWHTCVALERSAEAAEGILRVIRRRASQGELAGAASLWSELMDVVPDARADAGTLIRIVPVLYEIDRERALRALRAALDPATPGLTPGLAMRAVEVARAVDPPTCLRAARMALESKDLAEAKRARLVELIAELERAPAAAAPAQPTGTPARPVPPAPRPARAPVAVPPIAAQTEAPAAEPGDDFADVLVEETVEAFAPATRFSGVKAMEAVPRELAADTIELRMDDGRHGRIEYTKIQAVAVAEVAGLAAQPVVLVDLVLNWRDSDGGPLRVVRMRGDRVAVAAGQTADPRAFLAKLLAHVEAPALPDSGSALGHPFRFYGDIDSYQREVLQAG